MRELLAVAAIVFGGLFVLASAVMTTSYYIEKDSCYSFGRESEREVRWVKFNLVSWDCLTPTQNGKWISTDRLRDID